MKKIIGIIFLLIVLIVSVYSCSPKLKYGLYKYEDPFIGEYMILNPDSTFSFAFIYSAFSDSVSGIYEQVGDTLIFNSVDSYKPKIVLEKSEQRSKLFFKDHEKESLPGVSCKIKLSDGTELNASSDFDGLVSVDTNEPFYIECSFPGFITIKESIDITEYSNITIWLDISNLGRGLRKFANERYVIKRNKLICIEDSVDISFKHKRKLFK